MRTVSILIAAALGLVLFNGAVAHGQEQPDVLKMLAEKARQREELLDGVNATYSGQAAIAGNQIADLKGSWTKDAARSRSQFELTRKFLGVESKYSLTQVSDGRTLRGMYNEAGSAFIAQSKGPDYWTRSEDYGPGCLAGTRLHMMPGRLSEILSGDTKAFTEKYKDDMPVEGGEFQVKLCGEESVGGQKCAVVECGITGAPDGQSGGCRMYFGEDVNYTCVRIEAGEYKDGALDVEGSVTMSDFREVKKGVFVAYVASLEATAPDTGAKVNGLYKVETLEFPAEFDPNMFALEFPAGTWVYDRTARLWHKAGEMGIWAYDQNAGRWQRAGEEIDREVLSDWANEASDATAIAQSTDSQVASAEKPSAPPVPVAPESPGRSFTTTLILLAALAAVAAFTLLRRRGTSPGQ